VKWDDLCGESVGQNDCLDRQLGKTPVCNLLSLAPRTHASIKKLD